MKKRNVNLKMFAILFIIALAMRTIAPTPVRAASTLVVTTLVDENNGMGAGAGASLREAISAAAAGDTIIFNVTGTLTLSLGALNVTKNLTIAGPGASLVTISGNSSSRIFSFTNNVTVTIKDLTLTNGYAGANNGGAILVRSGQTLIMDRCAVTNNSVDTAGYAGGGISVEVNATLQMTNCELSGNHSNGTGGTGVGGAIHSWGTTTLTNCTFSGNTADAGGGVYAGDGVMTINNSTIANNTAIDDVGGLLADPYFGGHPVINIKNTIIANNTDLNDARGFGLGNYPDIDYCSSCSPLGTITSGGYNVIRTLGDTSWTITAADINSNPLLGSLSNNGGQTKTIPLNSGSPAINLIPSGSSYNGAATSDQRGYGRTGNYDSGAYEYTGPEPEINLQGNGVSIVSGDTTPSLGDYTHFGDVLTTGAGLDHVFTIQNTGTGSLTVIQAWLDGANASDFSITSAPSSPVSPSSSTTISVHFAPSATGARLATLHVSSNDNNEAHYQFSIEGNGTTPTAVEVVEFKANAAQPPVPAWILGLPGMIGLIVLGVILRKRKPV